MLGISGAVLRKATALSAGGEEVLQQCDGTVLDRGGITQLCSHVCLQALQSVASAFLENEELPIELRPAIVQHMMMVHQSVRQFSSRFAEELRRHNYVTVSGMFSVGELGHVCF